MRGKKLISILLSGIMLLTSSGLISAAATENSEKSIAEVVDMANTETDAEPLDIDTEDYSAYLFAYFRDNREESLCYGVSRDGYSFRALNGGEPVFVSTLGTKHLRDPFIFRGEDNYFYIVVTDMNTALGWASQSTIAIFKTKDLINIEDSILVDYKDFDGFENCVRAWAPQVIWCPDHVNADNSTGAYMIYLAIENSGSGIGTIMYKHFATDLMDGGTYTVPENMITGQQEGNYKNIGAIDGDIIFDSVNSRYLMYFDGVRVAACDTIDGTYTELSEDGEGIYKGASPYTNYRSEGSNIFKLNNENKWINCADGDAFGTGYLVFETEDFNNYTQIGGKGSPEVKIDYDFLPRHGYVIPITENELDTLMSEYGYVDLPDKNAVNPLTNNLTLPYTEWGYKIAGNITLPETVTDGEGTYNVTWSSSDEDVIKSTKSELDQNYGVNYTEYPAGKVTRPADEDKTVTLTATTEKDGTEYTKKFVVTVKKAPEKSYKEMSDDGDFTGYLYASFIEPAVTAQYQQVYFASSDDGKSWIDLNNNKPVLTSTMGTKATRDHYIVRSPEGDRFYIIATDLDVTGGKWGDYGERGSKYIMVWESDDLINWSDQRMVKVADLTDDTNTGCVWAPEATYDEITGEYIMYWSGTDMKEGSPNKGRKVVYYSKTRDFRSFTPQKQFVYPDETIDGVVANTSKTFIDTTMIEGSDGLFYRTTKYEETNPLHVFVDVAEHPLGEFKRINTNLDDRAFLGTEGPGWFKYNKDDAEATGNKYCLMLDGYGSPNKGVGFFPNSVEDLNNTWESIENGTAELTFTRIYDATMRSYAKHGGIIPLTQEEYERVNDVYKSTASDLSGYINTKNLGFDIADTYPSYPNGWTLPADKSLDNNTYHYLGINGAIDMGTGYASDAQWFAMRFDMASNSGGDMVIRDTEGNNIIGYCYAPGNDGLWVGHGERSFGGNVKDSWGVNRFSNYLKTDIGIYSDKENTGHAAYAQHDICTIIVKNNNGAVDGTEYNGDYYAVETYINDCHVSTEYYKGSAKGIGGIESKAKQYYGALQIYASRPKVDPVPVDDKFKLFDIDFDNETTEAKKGKATAAGEFTYVDGETEGSKAAYFDGSSNYLSLKAENDGILLLNKDEIVVSMKVRAERPSTTNGWYFFTSWTSNAQNGRSRSYVGLMENGEGTKVIGERYRNSSGDPTVEGASELGQWQQITYVIGKDKNELYIDGKFCGEADFTGKETLSTILGTGTSQIAYVGKGCWSDGEYYNGAIDDITIYDFAPVVSIPNLTNIKTDIDLPTATAEKDGYSLTWKSSNEAVISNTGKVTRPKTGKANVTLTATIAFEDTVLTRTVDALVKGEDYYDLKLQISDKKGVDIQDNMYGLFYEDINYAGDGGLYAEMVENRSFEQVTTNANKGTGDYTANPGYAWSSSGTMKYQTTGGLNANNPTYLEFTGTSFNNQAYQGMYIENGKKYKVSFWAKSPSYTGAVNVKVGNALSGTVANSVGNEWKKYEVELTATGDARKIPLTVELASAGTVDFDMISVIPSDAVNGVFRKDLAELLKAINPGFLRFPGGCVVEGYNLRDRYQWKNSVGPVEERKQNWNRWAADTGFVNYNQTYGLGFYEYFELCEYLGCDALPVLSVGIPCEYQGGRGGDAVPIYKSDGVTYTDEFYEYIQDALDLVEFANSTDFANSKWAALRKSMGHEEPFNLTMIGIGNEQWEIAGNEWYKRYEAFEKEVHKVYPDMKLISTSGPSADGRDFDSAWSWIRGEQAKNEKFTYAVDEHYYRTPEWFLENDGRYDNYDRGTKVFAGEYAANGTYGNTLYSAIAEAAYMTGLERNADVVYMASYAPLLSRIGYSQWNPDMIWFDDTTSYGTPDYYVQKMYASNNGTHTLQTAVASDEKAYQTVSYDAASGDIIIKIANTNKYEQRTSIVIDGNFSLTGKAEEQLLTSEEWTDTNSISEPEKVKTVSKEINIASGSDYIVPAKSFIVLRIHTKTDNKLVSIDSFTVKDGKMSYSLTPSEDFDEAEYDVYTALYNENGVLEAVFKNEMSGNVNVDDEKSYQVKVMVWEKDTMKPAANVVTEDSLDNSNYKLLSYITNGSEYYGTWDGALAPAVGNSLHLAVSSDGGATYEPLNYNVGVLFADCDYSEDCENPLRGISKMLRNPYVFRMANGKWGVITARADVEGNADSTDGNAMIYISDDLTDFDFIGYLNLDTEPVYEPACVYENGTYVVSWANEDGGTRKEATTADFKTISNARKSNRIYINPTVDIDYAVEGTNIVDISKSTYDYLKNSLKAPENTGIKEFDDITVSKNGTVNLPEKATALYSDGSTQDYKVEWDTSSLNTSAAGTYTVTGTVQTKDYPSKFITNRADPCMLHIDNKYYFVATEDNGEQNDLYIRVADSIDGIATAEEHALLSGSNLIWAPEIHNVNGKLMIFYATGRKWDSVQSHVIVLNDGGDATKAGDWSTPVRITKKDGKTNLIDNGITLDMTCFEWNNKWYLAWSQRIVGDSKYGNESANIYIAEFNPSDPTKLTSDTAVISRPSLGWERSMVEVDEGPFVIKNNGKLYMTIATNGCNCSYAIKLLSLKENGNPLNPEDWKAKPYPILGTAMYNAEPGPGHSSFTTDENGDPVLVYHWGNGGKNRTTAVKNVHFNAAGEPVLNIPRGEQIKEMYRNVSVKVTVK